jgi:hypothetical protein
MRSEMMKTTETTQRRSAQCLRWLALGAASLRNCALWTACGLGCLWLVSYGSAVDGWAQERKPQKHTAPENKDEQAQFAHAQTLLNQARAAIGNDEAWDKLQNLSVRLKLERPIKYLSVQGPDKVEEKERTLNGKIELDFAWPDRYRRKFTTQTLSSYNYSFAEIINGDKAWRDPPLQVRSSQGDSRVVDVGDVERTLNMQTQGALQQLSLYTLMYLLTTPTCVPVKWRYEGKYKFTDQTQGAEPKEVDLLMGVLPDEFRPFLFLDPQTHQLVGVALAYVEALRPNVIVEVAALDRGYVRRTYQRAGHERRARTKAARMHEMRWLLSDFRATNGAQLPYRIDVTRDGELLETMTVRELSTERAINPKKFEGEPKVKY